MYSNYFVKCVYQRKSILTLENSTGQPGFEQYTHSKQKEESKACLNESQTSGLPSQHFCKNLSRMTLIIQASEVLGI